jgi:hypothetical protein
MEAIVGELVPIAAFVMVLGIVIVTTWVRAHYNSIDKARLHETVRLMVEKGQPVSSEVLQQLSVASNTSSRHHMDGGKGSDMRRGVTLVMVALALVALGLALYYVSDGYATGPIVGAAAFPGFIGLGFIVMGLISRPKKDV